MRAASLHALALSALAVTIGACSPTIPEGQLVCATAGDCPEDWACVGGLCYSMGPSDAGAMDAALSDGGAEDAGPMDGGGMDGGGLDGGGADGGADAGPELVVGLAAGASHSCAFTSAGRAFCWGMNVAGQIGDGSTTRRTSATEVDLDARVVRMSAGANHTCALDDAGTVWCWGQNLTGALGTGETSTLEDTPTAVSLTAPAVDVTAGTTHTCAALMDGSVRCWGGNGEGQVGNGNRTNALSPQLVSGVSAVVSVGAGDAHTCARASGGAVSCWGANEEGQLGNATIPTTGLMRRSLVPVLVDGIPDAATLAVGWDFACVVTTGGTVRCWGANASEQLGVMGPATAASVAPTMPSGVAPTALTAGGYDFLGSHGHTCAWSRDGAIACFGQNYYGEIGTGATFGNIPPTRVTLIETATVVAAGSSHTCAISSGTVYCWGRGDEGQLGNAATSSSAARVEVVGLP